MNLVDNAVRYAKSAVDDLGPAGRPLGRAHGHRRRARASPPPTWERAFDRFARLDDARSREGDEAGGAGLGLAIVRATAQAHGGTAHLEAAVPPPGLRAVVRLPGQEGPAEGRTGPRQAPARPARMCRQAGRS